MKPTVPCEVSRVVVMQDVRLRHQPASDRPFLAAIGILKPVEQARDKIRNEQGDDDFQDNHARSVTSLAALVLPDKLGPAFHAVDIMELPIILLVAKRSKIKSANDLWSNKRIAEPLISLKPNELICQLFQETLTNRGLSWLPKLEMDSLDLIEKYVEKGFGVGLSIRAPGRTCPSTIRAL